MLPYVALLVLSFLFCFVGKQRGKSVCSVGANRFTEENNLCASVFFLTLFLLLALRSSSVGRDIYKYKRFFMRGLNLSVSQVVEGSSEILYWMLTWLLGRLGAGFQVVLAVIALISIVPIAVLYNQDRRHNYLKILIFLNSSLFVMLFSGLRQSLAISIGAISYQFVKRKQPLWFLLSVLVAMGFHSSAFILLPMYPLYYFRIKKQHLYFIVPVVGLCFLFNRPIFQALLSLLSLLGSRFELLSYSSSGAFTSLILFALFSVFSYVIPDERKVSGEFLGLRNYLLFAVLLQCFTPIHGLAMRMNYYYILFIPVSVSMTLNYPSKRWALVAQFAELIMCVFFTAYYLIALVSTAATGGALDTVPYVPFWAGA